MDTKKIIEKIRKLLALARSPNANEAAAALEKARALMAQYGVDRAALDLAALDDVAADFVPSQAWKPPQWDLSLRGFIRRAFGVRAVADFSRTPMRVVFYGERSRAALAAYAYAVLGRQAASARRKYFAAQRKSVKRTTRIARADRFAEGWVIAAAGKLSSLTPSARENEILDLFGEREFPGLVPTESRAARRVNGADRAEAAGFHAGKTARLDVPVGPSGARGPELIEHA